MTRILVCLDKDEKVENPRYPTQPVLQAGGPGSGWPAPYLVATGQTGHAVVGLDIGTKYARIATFENNHVIHLTAAPIPSIACRLSSGHLIIGRPPADNTVDVIHHFRGLLATEWYVEAENGFYGADALTELLIGRLVSLGQNVLGRPISKAVLTTPATYTSAQRKALKAAAEGAGVDVLQLINEPTAAAFAYCYENPEFEGNILVYHIGAGCFAASVIGFHNGLLEVKCSVGNDSYSCNSFVDALVVWMIEKFKRESGFVLDLTPATVLRMLAAAESAIEDLHTSGQANIKATNLDIVKSRFSVGSDSHAYFMSNITWKEYLCLIEPIVLDSLNVVDEAIGKSGTIASEINLTLVVGDYRNLVPFWNRFYDRVPGTTVSILNSMTYPVQGAALQAALLSHSIRSFVVWDVLTEPVFVDDAGSLKQVIARGTPLPITAYHKCESPDATVNMNIVQGSEHLSQRTSLAEVTINNCPPTTEGETKVEVQFIADANGIIDYQARHIGLAVPLPVTVMDGQPHPGTRRWSDPAPINTYNEDRLIRLSRILNMPPLMVMNVLRSRGYSIAEIKNGRAIEHMLRRLTQDKRLKRREVS